MSASPSQSTRDPVLDLRSILDSVSSTCLGGEPVPADLAALWRAQLTDDTELLDAFEIVLLDDPDPEEMFAGFGEGDGVEPAAAAAFARMAAQVRVVAEALDGSLIGYWVGEGAAVHGLAVRPVASSPLVLIDGDGQFELCAMTFAEAMLQWTDPEEPDDFAEVGDALSRLGCPTDATDHDAVWAKLADFEEPNGLVLGYLVEARLAAAEPASSDTAAEPPSPHTGAGPTPATPR